MLTDEQVEFDQKNVDSIYGDGSYDLMFSMYKGEQKENMKLAFHNCIGDNLKDGNDLLVSMLNAFDELMDFYRKLLIDNGRNVE